MKISKFKQVLLGLLFIAVFAVSLRAVPLSFNYQGLISKDGVPLTAKKDIIFRIFNALTGGTNILNRDLTFTGVDIVDGVFNVEIGPLSAADISKINTNDSLFVEVVIDGETFRQKILSSVFALRAQSAVKVDTNSVTTDNIVNGTITGVDLNADALSAGNLNDISIKSGRKLFLDGGSDTYLYESAANTLSAYCGGTLGLGIYGSQVVIPATNKLYLDGGGDTYISEVSANRLEAFAGSTSILALTPNFAYVNGDAIINSGAKLRLDGASAGDTYISESASNCIGFDAGGSRMLDIGTVVQSYCNIQPTYDNSYSCGSSLKRWNAVYAVNGAIQTSVSSTKEDIKNLNPAQIVIPEGAIYKRREKYMIDVIKNGQTQRVEKEFLTPDMIGFIADDLPEEAFAVEFDPATQTYIRSKENVYSNAVVGILCEKIKKLEARIEKLESNK